MYSQTQLNFEVIKLSLVLLAIICVEPQKEFLSSFFNEENAKRGFYITNEKKTSRSWWTVFEYWTLVGLEDVANYYTFLL